MEPFVTLIDSVPFWGWWVLAIALVAFEVVLPTTHLLWPAIAAFVTGVLVLVLGDPFPAWQVAAFAVLTVVAALIGPRYLQRTYEETDHPELNRRGARVTGEIATVVEAFASGKGKVKLGDTQWLATMKDGSNPQAGAQVKVVEVEGTKLVVASA
ncbi:Putative activity regulator of membrane protease YbbK [Candidatus Phaeomarinobacter ectocarpi]|uniref:Putative activity regulator of membrane protease YbbK n=1 Tax=Candidatus Phaeomarinibacter ectocarpi TaxID=1458461 RepID=X5MMD8_9HYPH|nr:NfeD family protein [Candidatus Phaeomarinobacter ectocarpi]CDO60310.1 Putative activity regulator of membrane protease YbbK [Candidatus Phaeomarinobacter ectocarpi]